MSHELGELKRVGNQWVFIPANPRDIAAVGDGPTCLAAIMRANGVVTTERVHDLVARS